MTDEFDITPPVESTTETPTKTPTELNPLLIAQLENLIKGGSISNNKYTAASRQGGEGTKFQFDLILETWFDVSEVPALSGQGIESLITVLSEEPPPLLEAPDETSLTLTTIDRDSCYSLWDTLGLACVLKCQ
jgi:hypothetical protein